jgi:hypothetical protein
MKIKAINYHSKNNQIENHIIWIKKMELMKKEERISKVSKNALLIKVIKRGIVILIMTEKNLRKSKMMVY